MRVLVTGASRGIGAELARRYRADGAEVLGTSTTGSAGLIAMDLTRSDEVAALAKVLGDGALDLLVCNAGVFVERAHPDDPYAPEHWATGFATNVTGTYLTIQAALPALRRATHPRIAVLSSQLGSSQRAGGGSYIYRASKAAVANLAANMAPDLAPRIAIAAYHPGHVRTDMGGAQAPLTVGASATDLIARFAELTPTTSGGFYNHDGALMPW